jgi:hypothetical protein
MDEGEPTSAYKPVEYKDFAGESVRNVKDELQKKDDWTVFKLRASFAELDDGVKLLRTELEFPGMTSARGRVVAKKLTWRGFQDWLIGKQSILGALNSGEDMAKSLASLLSNFNSASGEPEGYERSKIKDRATMVDEAQKHTLFYNVADGQTGRLRLRLTSKFVEALYEASPEFKGLRNELYERGLRPGVGGAKPYEFWSIMFVYPGAEDQKGSEKDGAPLKSCVSHTDNAVDSYYVSNIVPLTVDPPEAGGTVMVNGRCQAELGSSNRLVNTPLNTYGYVLSFRGGAWHFGAANRTSTHLRIFIMQVLSSTAEDPNDEKQRPGS